MNRYEDRGALINPDADTAHLERVEVKLAGTPPLDYDKKKWEREVSPMQGSTSGGTTVDVQSYAQRWARLMQIELLSGKSIAEVYEDTSREAAIWRTTRHHVNEAAYLLGRTWVHGAELNRLYWYPELTVDPDKVRSWWAEYWAAEKSHEQALANAAPDDSGLSERTSEEWDAAHREVPVAEARLTAAREALERFYATVSSDSQEILEEFLQAKAHRESTRWEFDSEIFGYQNYADHVRSWDKWAESVAKKAPEVGLAEQRFAKAQRDLDGLTSNRRMSETFFSASERSTLRGR